MSGGCATSAPVGDLVNTLSWSASRAALYEVCPRAYWYQYYGSWGGWARDADPVAAEIWLLKKLCSRHAWAGSAVHSAIEWALRSAAAGGGEPPTLPHREEAQAHLRRQMVQGFRESRAKAYRRPYRGPRPLSLLEHEYEVPVPDEAWRELYDHAQRCLERFYEEPVVEEILATPREHWYALEARNTFDFEGTPVYFAPDFAFRDAAGRTRIVDWKTGEPKEKDLRQLYGYALFAQRAWGTRPEEIVVSLHYLARGEVHTEAVDPARLTEFEGYLRESIRTMRAALVDEETADPKRLPPRPDPAACGRCKFARICFDAAAAPGMAPGETAPGGSAGA